MNQYVNFKERKEKEINEFVDKYMFFCFNEKQFEEGMEKLNLEKNDINKLVSIHGGYCLKEKIEEFKEISNRFSLELKTKLFNDASFASQAFVYELNNHEFGYTGEIEDTLNSLNLNINDIENNVMLKNELNKAKKYINSLDF